MWSEFWKFVLTASQYSAGSIPWTFPWHICKYTHTTALTHTQTNVLTRHIIPGHSM